jgi:hypothetical protein
MKGYTGWKKCYKKQFKHVQEVESRISQLQEELASTQRLLAKEQGILRYADAMVFYHAFLEKRLPDKYLKFLPKLVMQNVLFITDEESEELDERLPRSPRNIYKDLKTYWQDEEN